MTLTNIGYGTLASSETLNNNFSYLDDRISSTSETIMTSISSILSNIATINSRLTEISENSADLVSALNTKVEDYRAKTKLLVNKATLIPNWDEAVAINLSSSDYTVPANGYIFALPVVDTSGNITVNNVSIEYKINISTYDNASMLTVFPVQANDKVSCTALIKNAFFVPAAEVSISDF